MASTNSPQASTSSSSTRLQPTPQAILQSILRSGKAKPSEEDVQTNAEHYETRVKDKRLQLANPDRPRPKPSPESTAAQKLKRRHQRCDVRVGGPSSKKRKAAAVEASTSSALSVTARRHRGLEGLDEETSYTALLPLADLWGAYIQQFLSLVKINEDPKDSAQGAAPPTFQPNAQYLTRTPDDTSWTLKPNSIQHIQTQACKADLLGARLSVTRCANPSFVGVSGIVAKETEGTFIIAVDTQTKKKFKVVPKRNTTFNLIVPLPQSNDHMVVPLQGNQLTNTMVTRAVKKWKARKTMDY